MALQKLRRLSVKCISDKRLLLTGTFLISLLLWDLKRSGTSLVSSGLNAMSSIKYRTKPLLYRSHADKVIQQENEATPCPIIDFFATADATAHTYHKHLICDEKAKRSDIVCRMYLHQIGLEHLEESTCRLDNPGRVPKIVYFVIFGNYVFKFWHYVAIKAARRFVGTSAVYVIGDQHPQGRWWNQVLRDTQGVR